MTNDVATWLTALEDALLQVEAWLGRLRALEEVSLVEVHAALQDAMDWVGKLRAHAAQLADRAGVATPSWRDRESYLSTVAALEQAIERRAQREREQHRRAAIARVIERGCIEHPQPKLRAVYLELTTEAVRALREALDMVFEALAGPDDPVAWVRWARTTPGSLRGVVPAAVADFLDHVPEGVWRFADEKDASMEPEAAGMKDGHGGDEGSLVASSVCVGGEQTVASQRAPFPGEEVLNPVSSEGALGDDDASSTAVSLERVGDGQAPRAAETPASGAEAVPASNAQEALQGGAGHAGLPGARCSERDGTSEALGVYPTDALSEPTEQGAHGFACAGHGVDEGASAHAGPLGGSVRLGQLGEAGASEAAPCSPDLALDDELRRFEDFRERWWYAPSGELEHAPWHDEAFAGCLVEAFARGALQEEPPFQVLWAMAAAAQAVGNDTLPLPDEWVVAVNLWHDPLNTEFAGDPERVRRLRDGLNETGASPRTRLQLVFEALAPSHEVSDDDVELFVLCAEFQDQSLQAFVEQCLRASARGEVPIRRLREVLSKRSADPDTVARKVDEAREAFRKEFGRIRHAGGGNIEHTHCRNAWREFVDEIEPRVKELVAVRDPSEGELEALAKKAREITVVHARIANKHDAKLKDRHKMDRHAERLCKLALEVVLALRERAAVVKQRPLTNGYAALKEAWQGLLGAQPSRGDEVFARRLFLRAVEGTQRASERDPFGVSLGMVVAQPDLVACFDDIDLSDLAEGGRTPQATDTVVDVRKTIHPRHLAALWLHAPAPVKDDSHSDLLRAFEQQAHLRPFQMVCLPLLSDSERRRIHALVGDEVQRLRARHARLKALWQRLSDLAVGMAKDVREVEQAIERTLDHEPAEASLPLYGAWVDAVIQRAERAVERAKEALSKEAQRMDPELARSVRKALEEERFAEAHRLFYDKTAEPVEEALRQTMFRWEARRRFAVPSHVLQSSALHRDLIEAWCRGVMGERQRQDHTLRTAFKNTFFRADNLQPQNQPKELRVSCERLREWLKLKRLNPSFVPQLARYRDLVVLTPPAAPHEGHFVQSVGAQVAGYGDHLVAVLAPQLTERVRGDVCTELRRRHGAAAVVDDLDLCRILNLGGDEPNLLLALLEVLFEQQRWTSVNPFMVPDGQNVQMEMFVGRRDEARELARTPRYSRLFSGRKLGKSALLRFIEATEDDHPLPSGRTLRVLYVSAVGVDSERALVQCIEEVLCKRFKLRLPPKDDRFDSPRERLQELVRAFRSARSDDSLLVVLDEADTFVEQQVEAYERERERCLSFFMRSEIEKDRDSQGLPYVRFVFSGYRATHTTRGAWANWGDVLRLAPLAPDEAAVLVAQPLARLGIEARRQMRSIAHRCGYQPAVLLRFGECMLAHLEQRFPIAAREQDAVEVSDEDVALTFEDERIQEEIRTVVGNNFQGNPVGLVVFGAVLMAFLRLPLGHSLSDASGTVLAILRELSDGDLGWLGQGEGLALDVIRVHLRDLVERQLLIERRTPGRFEAALALRFPHHLSTLAPSFQAHRIREEIQSLKRTGAAEQRAERCEVIPFADLQQMRDFEGWQGMRVLSVVTSLWPEALLHPGVGLPDRLGIDSDRVLCDPTRALLDALAPQARRTLVHGVSPERVVEIVQAWPKGRALPVVVGGAELLRWALRGGQEARACEEDLYVEPFALGRWSLSTVTWWFTRVRGVNFPKSTALEEVMRRTGGMGFLLRLFDEVLFRSLKISEGQDVSQEIFERALSCFEQGFAGHVQRLRAGDNAVRLDARELEILSMVERVYQQENAVTDLRELLTDFWDECFRGDTSTEALGASDVVPLAVLQRLGLLPVRGDRCAADPFACLSPLEASDVLFRMVHELRG